MEFKHLSHTSLNIADIASFMDREICKLAAQGWTIDQSIVYATQHHTADGRMDYAHNCFVRMVKKS